MDKVLKSWMSIDCITTWETQFFLYSSRKVQLDMNVWCKTPNVWCKVQIFWTVLLCRAQDHKSGYLLYGMTASDSPQNRGGQPAFLLCVRIKNGDPKAWRTSVISLFKHWHRHSFERQTAIILTSQSCETALHYWNIRLFISHITKAGGICFWNNILNCAAQYTHGQQQKPQFYPWWSTYTIISTVSLTGVQTSSILHSDITRVCGVWKLLESVWSSTALPNTCTCKHGLYWVVVVVFYLFYLCD